MDKEILEKYKRAGSIAAEVKKWLLPQLKPGAMILELAEKIEGKIQELGARPAFPVNISINDVTAHYTPTLSDTTKINPGDLVKIDLGVQADGYIGDLAFTYCSENNLLIKSAEEALKAGIRMMKPGVSIPEISEAIHGSITSSGFGPIVNLTGHNLGRYVFHGGVSIPNVPNDIGYVLRENDVFALEPFVAATSGQVKESETVEIYNYLQDRPVRLPEARRILALARDEYKGLPFAKRWLKEIPQIKLSLALRQLEATEALRTHPVLRETTGKPVAQAEHTVIVMDKPLITTLL